MRRLVALDLPASERFVAAMQRCFDAGDAVFPVDQRLPHPARSALFEALRPAAVIGPDGSETALSASRPTQDGDAFVIATSGTTGTPRGVVLTHQAVAASSSASNHALRTDPTDHWLCCLPIAHVGGMSVITRCLAAGARLTVHERFDPAAVTRAVEREAVTLTSLVPTALTRLRHDVVSSLRTILLGGSRIPDDRPANTVATYGMTETASGVVYDGRPLDNVEVRVDDGGEIALRAPMLLRAYRDGTDPKDEQGWFRTGDGGSLLDGVLHVDGRLAEVINTGGEKVWPSAVEAVLSEAPGVREIAICGVADAEWGERVVAFVVLEDEATVALEELREIVRQHLGAFAAPRELTIVKDLPKTALGKIRRDELVAMHTLVTR